MFLEVVRSEGLSHLSFVVGDSGRAVVIDPRRDCGVYMDIARRYGARITHIFETHRHEDFLTGSKELSLLTSASVYHGGRAAFRFGNPALDDDRIDLGRGRLTILETPGHTPESISLALADLRYSEEPVAVFTGDTLTIGGTGRVDLFPGRGPESAGMLYDSIFNRLLPLGDHVAIYPSHTGDGGIRGSERSFSTLGFERRYNPSLRAKSRDDFIAARMGERYPQSPHYSLMLRQNLEGPPLMNGLPQPQVYNVEDFAGATEPGMFIVDTRSPEAVCGARIPGSLALPMDRLSEFAGWFIPYNQPIGLVVSDPGQTAAAVRRLVRVGFDRIPACLVNNVYSWRSEDRSFETIPAVRLSETAEPARERFLLLDVRTPREFEAGHPEGAMNLFVGDIPDRLGVIPRDRPITLFSGKGERSVIAASILRMNGVWPVRVGLGGEMVPAEPEERPSEKGGDSPSIPAGNTPYDSQFFLINRE